MSSRATEALKGLSFQERLDFKLSRRFPKLSGRANRLVYQATRGRVGARHRNIPVGLLTTTGRRSGQRRTTPVMYLQDGSRFLVVASNGGLDAPPAWYLNLRAHPTAEFQNPDGNSPVQARELTEDEQTEIWERLVNHNPLWGAFQSCTDRRTTVVALETLERTPDRASLK